MMDYQALMDDVLPNLTESAQATLVRVAHKLAEEYTGEIVLTTHSGGVRSLKLIQTETGAMIRERLGSI